MSRLPLAFDPLLPRALNQTWVGRLGAGELPRVQALACESSGCELPVVVEVRLQVVAGALGERRLQGSITGCLGLQCQRCLKPWTWMIDLALDLALIPAELPATGAGKLGSSGGGGDLDDAPGLGRSDEVWELDPDGLLRPATVIEDEILLALPLAPRHPDCPLGWQSEFAVGAGEAENPFAVLQSLRPRD